MSVFNAVIPEDCADNIKTVYLLHGLSDNHTAWERRSSVERYAQNSHVALIMPNVDRSFYTDMKFGRNFFTPLSHRSLLTTQEKVFRLSKKSAMTHLLQGFLWAVTAPLKLLCARAKRFPRRHLFRACSIFRHTRSRRATGKATHTLRSARATRWRAQTKASSRW
ncbi:MAG: hypothetical protein L6V93_17165 [Clostridiales bacterium]|nr:MAG: hypothetical protein L6V93_17165 [Clostridiales bacterium]